MKVLGGRPIPLFPLPSIVLYPRIVQPLHVFEPRYRQMFSDVLDSHGKIAMALLKPGYEEEYHGSPAIHAVVGVGSIATYQTRDDGTSDLILLGECRATIVEESKPDDKRLYRQASLVHLRERQPHDIEEREKLRERLERWLRYSVKELEGKKESLESLQDQFKKESDLGFLVDFLAFHFIKDHAIQQLLMEELSVAKRGERLLEELGDK